jgi:hypothetical protein
MPSAGPQCKESIRRAMPQIKEQLFGCYFVMRMRMKRNQLVAIIINAGDI